MTLEKIREAYAKEPFHPFVMHMADGREVTVHHREFMATEPNGRTVYVYQPDGSGNLIDLLLVTDLKFRSLPPSRRGDRKR